MKINNVNNLLACISTLESVGRSADIVKHNDKTHIVIYNGFLLVDCIIPEIDIAEMITIDLKNYKKLLSTIKEGDTLDLDIKEDRTIALVKKNKTEKKYEFSNLNTETQSVIKFIEKLESINPKNVIKTTNSWINEQINSLLFKENDKLCHKVNFEIQKERFTISDKNSHSGTSQISLFEFDEYKLTYSNDSKTIINWLALDKPLSNMKSLSNEILIKLDDTYPIKMIAYQNEYKITLLLAPIVENK